MMRGVALLVAAWVACVAWGCGQIIVPLPGDAAAAPPPVADTSPGAEGVGGDGSASPEAGSAEPIGDAAPPGDTSLSDTQGPPEAGVTAVPDVTTAPDGSLSETGKDGALPPPDSITADAGPECIYGVDEACDDGDTCTLDTCLVDNTCSHAAVGNVCKINGVCYADGTPHGSEPCLSCDITVSKTGWTELACDDQNPCTTDVCSGQQCVYPPDDSATCDDGDSCTVDDHCADGHCDATPCECQTDADCAAALKLTPCVKAVCVAGACEVQADPFKDGTPCNDGSECTIADHCEWGECVGSWDPAACGCTMSGQCQDGLSCTSDVCEGGACVFKPFSGYCVAGSSCLVTGAAHPQNACLLCGAGAEFESLECESADLCAIGFCDPDALPTSYNPTSPDTACAYVAAPADTLCRPTQFACDPTELCTGQTLSCPADQTTCPAGQFCAGQTCQSLIPDGGPCAVASQCANGYCVSGICCDSACDGICETCQGGPWGVCQTQAPNAVSGSFTMTKASGSGQSAIAGIVGYQNSWTWVGAGIYTKTFEDDPFPPFKKGLRVHASSFTFTYAGDNAKLLDLNVAQYLTKGGNSGGYLEITVFGSYCDYNFYILPDDTEAHIYFAAMQYGIPCKVDKYGYPVLEPMSGGSSYQLFYDFIGTNQINITNDGDGILSVGCQ